MEMLQSFFLSITGMSVESFFQHLSNGISLGSLYALIAIGYTMVYGILRLINFAHGDIFMISIYSVFYGVAVFAIPWPVAVILSIVITVFLGISIEKTAYRPLRNSSKISILISAIGVSFFLQNLATVVFGGRPKAYPVPEFFSRIYNFSGISITSVTFFIPVMTIFFLFVLLNFINHTKTGMAMRAVSRDYEASRLMAIDVDFIIMLTFGIGSALAAIGGIMWGLKYPQISPFMGVIPGLKCFIAAVIGGIGNIKGAVLGGFMLGIGEILIVAFLPSMTGYRDAFAFVLLILILLVKPQGLLGENVSEKV